MKSFISISLIIILSQHVFALTEIEKFEMAWKLGKSKIYPKRLENHFNKSKFNEIERRILKGISLSDAMNPFLKSLNISHTHIYDKERLGYYVLKSLFYTKDINSPEYTTIGAQFSEEIDGLKIRAILEGFPAEQVGLHVGDIITHVEREKVSRASIFNRYVNKWAKLSVLSNGKKKVIKIKPIKKSIHGSFLEATKNSIRIIKKANKRVGYIHLWSGTNSKFLEILKETVLKKFKMVDGIILDLRDGFGGAWWDYLDPFYGSTKDYFIATQLKKDGTTSDLRPVIKENKDFFSRPMVVLINGGVRSGKEAVAYQFKKSKRAILVGTNTRGAFTGGYGGFSDKDLGFIFYVSSFGILLDGNKVEGVGISPDLKVIRKIGLEDNQLDSAIDEIFKVI